MTIEVRNSGELLPTEPPWREPTVITAEDAAPWVDAAGAEHWDPRDRAALDRKMDYLGRQLARWVTTTRKNNTPSIFNRMAYVAPDNPYAQMATAKTAVDNDDIIGGVCDVTEGLTFQGVKWESQSEEDTDTFNQMARDLNLDEFVRQWHREDYTYSQAVIGMWWGRRQYKYRGKTGTGKASKRTREIYCPVALTFLDPMRVFPLKPGMFGQERLAWHATKEEMASWTAMNDGNYQDDPILREFILGPANITDKAEQTYIAECGMDYRNLLLLNPYLVTRLSRTKMPYERFSPIRLKSTFAQLDLKQHLIDADRVSLVGAANFILLVKQGSDTLPADQAEIDNLKAEFKVVAKLPVIIGDHRLNVEIITPDQEYVLASAKYDTIDRRLLNRALGALSIGGSGQRNESTLTVARGVARMMENRRHMLKRWCEASIARMVVEHPANEGKFDEEPNLTFTPRNVQLDTDAEMARSIMALRTQKDLSRESALEYFGFDQAVEAMRREIEEERYDDIFQTVVPFTATDDDGTPTDSSVDGAKGGRPTGGGDSAQSPQGQSGARTSTGNKSTSK